MPKHKNKNVRTPASPKTEQRKRKQPVSVNHITRAFQAGVRFVNSASKPPGTIAPQLPVTVSVVHGDLAFASHPVMVGHYEGDTITSAEKYLDGELGDALTHRHVLNLYPGPIGTSAIVLNPKFNNSEYVAVKGAIVVGLGQVGRLNASSLNRTVARAMQEYVLQWHDSPSEQADQEEEESMKGFDVTSLLIGTGTGGVSVADAMRAVLVGVANANRLLYNAKARPLLRIRAVEFIELWEDPAIEAVKELTKLANDPDFVQFKFQLALEKRKGGKQRLSRTEPPGWWQRLQILGGGTDASGHAPLRFTALTKRARVEVTLHQTQRAVVDNFIEQSITTTKDNDTIAQTLFELLLPKDLKDQARDQDDLVLILDKDAASYPWELLRDPDDKNDKPNSVRRGLLRQLETLNASPEVRESYGFNALVVGDPISQFTPLTGARDEARAVCSLLKDGNFDTGEPLIQRSATDIINALYAKPYRVLHLAGHGVYNFVMPAATSSATMEGDAKEQRRTGMILSDGIVLSPSEVRQMRNVPELVFINCCHLGRIEQEPEKSGDDNIRGDYNRIAANVATEFIQSGVRAVIAAGWAVDDDGALTFATTFYKAMLNGETFGNAVRRARAVVYDKHEGSNTWGAYQCYGDPDYRFRKIVMEKPAEHQPDFASSHEAAVEIENIAVGLAFSEREDRNYYKEKLDQVEKVLNKKGWLGNGRILAALGWANGEAEEFDKAIAFYERAEKSVDGLIRYRDIREWANLEVRYAAKRMQRKDGSKGTTLAEFEKTVERAITRLKSLPTTPETLRLQGSAYKRIAMFHPDKRMLALREMTSRYAEAYGTKTKAGTFDAYGFLNWKTGEIALALQKGRGQVREKLKAELKKVKEQIQATGKNRQDFWDAVMRVDLEVLLALTESKIGTSTVAGLINDYTETKKLASAREFASVIDQLDFLFTMAHGKNHEIADALLEIREKISPTLWTKKTRT